MWITSVYLNTAKLSLGYSGTYEFTYHDVYCIADHLM